MQSARRPSRNRPAHRFAIQIDGDAGICLGLVGKIVSDDPLELVRVEGVAQNPSIRGSMERLSLG